jgi:hypothetical protein
MKRLPSHVAHERDTVCEQQLQIRFIAEVHVHVGQTRNDEQAAVSVDNRGVRRDANRAHFVHGGDTFIVTISVRPDRARSLSIGMTLTLTNANVLCARGGATTGRTPCVHAGGKCADSNDRAIT